MRVAGQLVWRDGREGETTAAAASISSSTSSTSISSNPPISSITAACSMCGDGGVCCCCCCLCCASMRGCGDGGPSTDTPGMEEVDSLRIIAVRGDTVLRGGDSRLLVALATTEL